ncbi:MAG: hypothetical protein IPM92_08510 [Saprospiraceae bacterium]|nr:hypothetical protein [Saprospiraceae bacterium]
MAIHLGSGLVDGTAKGSTTLILFEKINFRFGLYYQDDYRVIKGEQAYQLGFTLGWAYPVIFLRQDALIHLNLDMGQRKAGDLLKENYIQLTFGVTINDNEWFLKRKYN